MLYAVAIGLFLLWLLGLVSSHTIIGLVQVLLIVVLAIVLLRVIGKYRAS